jgi:hypothetical protein
MRDPITIGSFAIGSLIIGSGIAAYLTLTVLDCYRGVQESNGLLPNCVNVFHPLIAVFITAAIVAVLSAAILINESD